MSSDERQFLIIAIVFSKLRGTWQLGPAAIRGAPVARFNQDGGFRPCCTLSDGFDMLKVPARYSRRLLLQNRVAVEKLPPERIRRNKIASGRAINDSLGSPGHFLSPNLAVFQQPQAITPTIPTPTHSLLGPSTNQWQYWSNWNRDEVQP
jgi:hypothetical protein